MRTLAATSVAYCAVLLGVNLPQPAAAQVGIGALAVAERSVTGAFRGRSRALDIGDGVVQNEVIRTGAASAARIVFRDATNLSMGATATVTLDRFVFDGGGTARSAVINLTRGAFRWVSGRSPSRAYQVRTPLATIGVRGTVFDVLSVAGRTVVVLEEGAVRVCTRSGSGCVELDRPGEMVTVTARGVSDPRLAGPNDFDFTSTCDRSGAALCFVNRRPVVPIRMDTPQRTRAPQNRPVQPWGYDPAGGGNGSGPSGGDGGGGQGSGGGSGGRG